jgi:hypothetical protein
MTSMTHIGADRCLDLVLGLLSADEREATLAHIRSCAACEQRFRATAADQAHAESEMATSLRRLPATSPIERRRPARAYMIAAAASIVAILGVARFAWTPSHQGKLIEVASPRLPPAQLRGAVREFGTSSADSVLLRGLQAYDRGDMLAARELLRAAQATGSWESVRRIYLAGALLELEDAAGAAAVVHEVDLRWVPEPWNSEARWTLALALARSGRRSAADSILAILSRETGPVAERARARRSERAK